MDAIESIFDLNRSRYGKMKQSLLFLTLFAISGAALGQDDAFFFGIGGAGGISLTTTREVGATYQVTCGWERYLDDPHQLRLKGDLGMWSAGRVDQETYGRSRRIGASGTYL